MPKTTKPKRKWSGGRLVDPQADIDAFKSHWLKMTQDQRQRWRDGDETISLFKERTADQQAVVVADILWYRCIDLDCRPLVAWMKAETGIDIGNGETQGEATAKD